MHIIVCGRRQLAKINSPESDIPAVVGQCAIISISDSPDNYPKIPTNIDSHGVLQLCFDDIEVDLNLPEKQHIIYTPKLAKKVAAFVLTQWSKVKTIIFQCEMGVSRSAGIAAAVARHFGLGDLQFFRDYLPNRLVYRLTIEKLRECSSVG